MMDEERRGIGIGLGRNIDIPDMKPSFGLFFFSLQFISFISFYGADMATLKTLNDLSTVYSLVHHNTDWGCQSRTCNLWT